MNMRSALLGCLGLFIWANTPPKARVRRRTPGYKLPSGVFAFTTPRPPNLLFTPPRTTTPPPPYCIVVRAPPPSNPSLPFTTRLRAPFSGSAATSRAPRTRGARGARTTRWAGRCPPGRCGRATCSCCPSAVEGRKVESVGIIFSQNSRKYRWLYGKPSSKSLEVFLFLV